MKSLNQIIAELETFANVHYQIHTFGHGDVWEIAPNSSEIVYPVLWFVPQGATTGLREVTTNFTVLCMDLVRSGEENETEVLSDTLQIILDVVSYYRQQHDQDYIVEFGSNIQPFTERDPDMLSGHSITVSIRQPFNYSECAIPFSGAPAPVIPTCAPATIQNASTNPTYQASAPSGGSFVLPQIKVLDSDGITEILADYIPESAGYAAECSTSCPDGTVENSDASYQSTVGSGGTLVLPNITVTDSDGTTSSVPSVQDIMCTPSADATVENSNDSYSDTVASGGTLVVPDTPISANGDLIVNQPSTIAKDLVVRYETQGVASTTIVSGEIVVPDSVPITPPIITKSVSLDGVNDYLVSGCELGVDEDWSVTFSVKMLDTARDNAFMSLQGYRQTRPSFLIGYEDSSQELRFASWTAKWSIYSYTITPDTNWHKLAISYNYATTTLKVYYDNVLVYTNTSWTINNSLTNVVYGYAQDWANVGVKYGNIRVTDMRNHNATLTASEVADVYNGLLSGNETSFVPVDAPVGKTTGYIDSIVGTGRMELNNITAPFGVVLDAP